MPVNLAQLWQFLRHELAPQEGRLALAWRTAAVCALVAMVFMTYGIPLAPIACYLVLFVIKPNTSESLLMGMGVIVLVGLMIPILVWLAAISADHIVVRMLVLSVGSFIFMYLSVASKVGPVGSIIALVIGFIMTLVGIAPIGELMTRGILYAALMAVAPMGVMLIFLFVLGPSPAQLLQRHLQRRCQAIAAALRAAEPAHRLRPILRDGNGEIDKMRLFATLFAQRPKALLEQFEQVSASSYQLTAALLTLPSTAEIAPQTRAHWAAYWDALALACGQAQPLPSYAAFCQAQGYTPAPPAAPADGAPATAATLAHLHQRFESLPAQPADALRRSPLPQSGFFNDDVATNRSYTEFGVKVTFCAVICYLTYTALQWQDIHTAMITCYVAALGTVGETVRKLLLRICGCLVGAALGIAAILFLMPHMTSIGQLMALVFAGCFVAAWVSLGSERISYGGVQIGLAFTLTVLQGFGPDVSISVAMDRIYGILLGNFVLFIVFTQVWPVSAASRVVRTLNKHIQGLGQLLQHPQAAQQMQAALPELLPQLQALREQSALRPLEAAVLRTPTPDQAHMQASINELETVYLQAAFGGLELQTPAAQQQMQALQRKVLTAEGP